MADVILTTETSTSQSLTSDGDVYFLQEGVLHYSSTTLGTLILDGNSQSDYSIFINGTIANFGAGDVIQDNSINVQHVSFVIGATGNVQGTEGYRGFFIESDDVLITNNGEISAAEAVRMGGLRSSLYNNGLISGTFNDVGTVYTVVLSETGARIVNSGTITGSNGVQIDNDGTFINSGDIVAANNAVNADAASSSEVIVLNNSGVISGGNLAYEGERGQDLITNSGIMQGNIETDRSDDILVNSGTITGDVDMNDNNDTVINTGIIAGSVMMGTGSDVYNGKGNSVVSGGVDGGTGNDTLVGGTGEDDLTGGFGFDSLKGGGGDDTLMGGDNNDTLKGGADADFLDGEAGDDSMLGGSGDDELFGRDGMDTLSGNSGNDALNGGLGDDTLNGDSGEDVLNGGEGFDRLFGGKGDDDVTGGLNRDVLLGGAGADTFIYNDAADSTSAETDGIRDFERGVDKINLGNATGLELVFNDTTGAIGGGTASVWYTLNGSGQTILRVDTDGDGVQDMKIKMFNITALDTDDFIL